MVLAHTHNPSYTGVIVGKKITVQANLGKIITSYLKNNQRKKGWNCSKFAKQTQDTEFKPPNKRKKRK
jgi:hypothetical protein